MDSTTATEGQRMSGIRAAALFILVAVPGVFLFLFALGRLFLAAVKPEYRTAFHFIGLAAGLLVGSLAMLAGTQRWSRWLYLVVLVPMPFVWFALLEVMVHLETQEVISPTLMATILTVVPAVWGARRIDQHYRRGGKS